MRARLVAGLFGLAVATLLACSQPASLLAAPSAAGQFQCEALAFQVSFPAGWKLSTASEPSVASSADATWGEFLAQRIYPLGLRHEATWTDADVGLIRRFAGTLQAVAAEARAVDGAQVAEVARSDGSRMLRIRKALHYNDGQPGFRRMLSLRYIVLLDNRMVEVSARLPEANRAALAADVERIADSVAAYFPRAEIEAELRTTGMQSPADGWTWKTLRHAEFLIEYPSEWVHAGEWHPKPGSLTPRTSPEWREVAEFSEPLADSDRIDKPRLTLTISREHTSVDQFEDARAQASAAQHTNAGWKPLPHLWGRFRTASGWEGECAHVRLAGYAVMAYRLPLAQTDTRLVARFLAPLDRLDDAMPIVARVAESIRRPSELAATGRGGDDAAAIPPIVASARARFESVALGFRLMHPAHARRGMVATCGSGYMNATTQEDLLRLPSYPVALFDAVAGTQITVEAVRLFTDTLDEAMQWYSSPTPHATPRSFATHSGIPGRLIASVHEWVEFPGFTRRPFHATAVFVADNRKFSLSTHGPLHEAGFRTNLLEEVARTIEGFPPFVDVVTPGRCKRFIGDGFQIDYPGEWPHEIGYVEWNGPNREFTAGEPIALYESAHAPYARIHASRSTEDKDFAAEETTVRNAAIDYPEIDFEPFVTHDGVRGFSVVNRPPMHLMHARRRPRSLSASVTFYFPWGGQERLSLSCRFDAEREAEMRGVFNEIARSLCRTE